MEENMAVARLYWHQNKTDMKQCMMALLQTFGQQIVCSSSLFKQIALSNG